MGQSVLGLALKNLSYLCFMWKEIEILRKYFPDFKKVEHLLKQLIGSVNSKLDGVQVKDNDFTLML